MKLTAIVGMTGDRVIGRDGDLPWRLSEDLKIFKRTTSGHPVVMGRKTYDSIGKPLPGRQNIVLTRDRGWSVDGVEVIHDPKELSTLELIDPHVYIMGGSEIYAAFLDQLADLRVSWVEESHPGDTYFPEFEHLFPQSKLLEEHDGFAIYLYTRD